MRKRLVFASLALAVSGTLACGRAGTAETGGQLQAVYIKSANAATLVFGTSDCNTPLSGNDEVLVVTFDSSARAGAERSVPGGASAWMLDCTLAAPSSNVSPDRALSSYSAMLK